MTESRQQDPQLIDNLWASLLADVDDATLTAPVSAIDINAQTMARMASLHRRRFLSFRLAGPGVRAHRLAVKTAANVLGSFQEVVSSIGAALSDRPSLFGQLSSAIRQATELQLSPAVAPGSIVFTLVPDEEFTQDEMPGLEGVPSLLDLALDRLISVFGELDAAGAEERPLVDNLRALGPRTAKHLFDLSQVVINDDVVLDLQWTTESGRQSGASMGVRSASFLREMIQQSAVTEREKVITGILVTVSVETPAAVRLDDGTRIMLAVDEDKVGRLAPLFNRRVQATVLEREEINLGTGRVSFAYTLIEIREEEEARA